MKLEPGFYWVRADEFAGSQPVVAQLWESRWWFSRSKDVPLETHPGIEVLSARLVLP